MRHARLLPLPVLAFAAGLASAEPVTYRMDPVHSQVVFNVDHNGFSRSFGRLRIAEGKVVFDRDDWSKSSVEATIDLGSVDMGDPNWDKAVRGSNLLDSARAGTARYVSDAVEKRGDDEGVVHGKLTLRGITLPLDIPFRVNRVGRTIFGMHTVAGFSAYVTLDRTAYGMTANRGSIGSDVAVWLEIEAIRGGEAGSNDDKETHDATAQ
ncbi:YceI family protein [Luteibacter yeojuensis]|uniref:Polyisoprenoid-binding protein n=1 Tax=Luteibacter yeojuensis TaxID=345309 RepID=A0A7X5QX57_9GAMM|nr:YceI family protein [Luteibacter yeojuensis]NID16964.1 polyisoprenoid-binding protein [Luteibacter yeojuensis]